jgi:hypothetical protein
MRSARAPALALALPPFSGDPILQLRSHEATDALDFAARSVGRARLAGPLRRYIAGARERRAARLLEQARKQEAEGAGAAGAAAAAAAAAAGAAGQHGGGGRRGSRASAQGGAGTARRGSLGGGAGAGKGR